MLHLEPLRFLTATRIFDDHDELARATALSARTAHS
jgi:hypothetical protein